MTKRVLFLSLTVAALLAQPTSALARVDTSVAGHLALVNDGKCKDITRMHQPVSLVDRTMSVAAISSEITAKIAAAPPKNPCIFCYTYPGLPEVCWDICGCCGGGGGGGGR